MWTIILLSALCAHHATAEELLHGDYLLNIDNGLLQTIKPTGDSSHIDLSGLKIKQIKEKLFDDLSGVKSLNLARNELESLPPSTFSKLTQLETLSLAENQFRRLEPNNFIGMDKLQTLNISNSAIRHLDFGVFHGLKASVNVILDGNDLFTISAEVFEDPAIRSISDDEESYFEDENIADEPKESLPDLNPNVQVKICKTSDGVVTSVEEVKKDESLGDCVKGNALPEIRRLDFSNLGLKKFQKGWYKIPALQYTTIDLSNNDITEITADLLNDLPAGVTFVDLAHNKIEKIMKNVIANEHLKILGLGNNFISTIEDGALENTKLINIGMSENRLKSLSFAKALPSTLRVMTAVNNSLVDIPEDSLKNMQNLFYLNLAENNVTDLPANTLRGLKKLHTIDLSHNQLSEIHPGTFEDQEGLVEILLGNNRINTISSGAFRGLKKVKNIALQSNKIKTIIKGAFPDTTQKVGYAIYLFDNEIENIEKDSFAIASVREINLGNNKISTIADGAFNIPTLTRLHLNDNKLVVLEENAVSGLPKLTYLHLESNKITTIKKGAIKNLSKLVLLDVSNNAIERLENGALYGFRRFRGASVSISNTPIKSIQGGTFKEI